MYDLCPMAHAVAQMVLKLCALGETREALKPAASEPSGLGIPADWRDIRGLELFGRRSKFHTTSWLCSFLHSKVDSPPTSHV